MSPIESVTEWCEGVGHGPEHKALYIALVLEEVAELLIELGFTGEGSDAARGLARWARAGLLGLSERIRGGAGVILASPERSLDAALDTAWVSLCLARTLVGDRLPDAWAELHRSNITDKQGPDGRFLKDSSGKVVKPAGWQPPDFDRFFGATDSEGGEV